ncbi:MAG: ATP-grasp domain-containing protein [Candidatus Hodarchaeota archaeon]
MDLSTKSVLVVGFNTRPLAYSLKNANYDVYAVDFFGDIDLYPNIKDSLVLTKELETDYESIRDNYSKLLSNFTIKMLKKYPEIDYLIIGSGIDDAYEEREAIFNEIKNKDYKIKNLNNDVKTLKKARDIIFIYNLLKSNQFNVPFTINYDNLRSYKRKLQFPIIFKKYKSAGGINVFKIENFEELTTLIKYLEVKKFNSSEWLIQEYVDGMPISCTTISNGNECEIISINRQIIGEQFLNSPKEFMYCGNIVPADLSKEEDELITKISKTLANELGLKGINGFDFVLKEHYPYLMEINPRIPGSIRASEMSYDINLMDLHIKSFDLDKWDLIQQLIRSKKLSGFSTKLIIFAPKEIKKSHISKINNLEYVHDKSTPNKNTLKGEPLCTILYKGGDLSESYKGAIDIVNKINNIIN